MRAQQESKFQKLNKTLKNNLVVRKKLVKACLCILFVAFGIALLFTIRYQLGLEQETTSKLSDAQEKELDLQKKLEVREEALLTSTKKYVEEVGAKPCVVLCFDNFEESAYGAVVEAMDKYDFKGVIIFRDGKVPGSKGAISVELYQSLLDKGWEGAIGNSESIRVYNNFPEVRRQEWSEYISGMQDAFQEKGLEVPNVYIPHKDEVLVSILDLLAMYDLKTYTNLKDDFQYAATDISLNKFIEMGMVVGKYNYDALSSDILNMVPTAESVAILFKKVENGAPREKQHTSVYVLREQLERLSMLSEYVNVTTFAGYREYQQELMTHNEVPYKNYLMEQSSLKNQIALLKSQIAENYAEIFEGSFE